jgi:hypothetical protein
LVEIGSLYNEKLYLAWVKPLKDWKCSKLFIRRSYATNNVQAKCKGRSSRIMHLKGY